MDLAAAVEGGKGDFSPNSMPSQGLYVSSSINAGSGSAQSDREELLEKEAIDTSTHSVRNLADSASEESEEEIHSGQPQVDPPNILATG